MVALPRGQNKGVAVNTTSLSRGVTSYNGDIGPVMFVPASDIPASSITYNLLQNETASTLLGNPTGVAAAPSEITLGATFAFSGSVLRTSAMTGDITTAVNSFVTILATVNTSTGSFGSSTSIPNFTVNAKGLITLAGGNVVVAPASTLTGTTLASNVTTSSLTVVGTITSGVWRGTKVDVAYGGTNADLSGTGGASRVLKQTSVGGAVTVAQLAASDLSNGTTGSNSVVLGTSPTLSNPVVGTQATTDNSTLAASTAYVTTAIANAVAGVNPAESVKIATTQASDTSGLTYNNGVAGVGAFFTGAVNTAITIDGVTLTSLNQRVLVKNDTQSPSGAFNGVYYLTQLQTAILPPILTRALDYNSPSDINNTGAVPVVSGTANTNTSWLLTTSVTTVGTDPLTYAQFSYAPSALPTLAGTNAYTGQNTLTPQVLTSSGASIAWNVNSGNNASHTATENTTLANPTNLVTGGVYTFQWTQHASSAKTLAFGNKWKFAGSSTVSVTVSTVQIFTALYDGTNLNTVMTGPFS